MFLVLVMPMIVDRRAEVEQLQHELQGRCYDLEYSLRFLIFNISFNFCIFINSNSFIISTIKSMDASSEPLKNTHELLKSAIFLKQQLRGEEAKRRPNTGNNQNSSVYKRLSSA